MPSARAASLLLTAGALGVAGTTALEVLTAPYSPAVRAYPVNGAVHLAKVVAALTLVAGLLRLAGWLRRRGAALGAAGAGALAGALLLGAVPYSVVEAFLDPGLDPVAADARLDEIHAGHPWIATTASVALPLAVLGVVVLAAGVLRRRALPAWAPLVSLGALALGVLAGVLVAAGWVLPHPPAWIVLGLAGYGPAWAGAALEAGGPTRAAAAARAA